MAKEKGDYKKLAKDIKKIASTFENLEKKLKDLGMVDEAIDEFMTSKGNELLLCDKCNTPNMVELSYNEKEHFSMYECKKCNRTYLMNWNNKEDYQRLKFY